MAKIDDFEEADSPAQDKLRENYSLELADMLVFLPEATAAKKL